MNFDSSTSISVGSLRAPGVVLNTSTTETTAGITPNGYRHTLFVINANITGARAFTGKIEQSSDNASWSDVPGTAFEFSVALGDGTAASRNILMSHAAVQQYVRVSVTHTGGTNVVPVIGYMQFNAVNTSKANTVNAYRG
jgi:hypothetical protein